MRPLDGIRVADFTKAIAGPLCTQYLSDLGADVIKIEDRDGGDDSRSWPPFAGDDGAIFLAMNRNKRSIALDLKTQDGKRVALEICRRADVVIESFGGGVAERLGIGYDVVRELNARAVYCSISAFGRTGPLSGRPGYEPMMQAFTGMMAVSGERDGGPVRTAFSPCDQTTGIHAVTGILAALLRRSVTGAGGYVEASLFETGTALMGWHAQGYWLTGQRPERLGSAHGSLVPYQAFEAADGHILVCVGSESLWRKFCTVPELVPLGNDPRFATNATRVQHRAELVASLNELFRTRSVDAWMERFVEAGVPCSPINHVDQALAHPQTAARGMVMEYEHPTGANLNCVAYPLSIEGVERRVRRAPPLHGQHTREILAELDYTEAEIVSLEQGEAVGKRSSVANKSHGR